MSLLAEMANRLTFEFDRQTIIQVLTQRFGQRADQQIGVDEIE